MLWDSLWEGSPSSLPKLRADARFYDGVALIHPRFGANNEFRVAALTLLCHGLVRN
jgi:hypothetical protein